MDRRFFIKSTGISLAGFGFMAAAPDILKQFANGQQAAGTNGRKILVTIFQRGAVDGLNMIVPHGESEYYGLRQSIAIPKPGKEGGAIDLDGTFGLHPSMAALKKYWDSKQFAIINAAGSPNNTRSHFDAQDFMESGTPGVKSTPDGWLNRAMLAQMQTKNDSPFRAVAMTPQLPRSLYGRAPTIAMTSLANFSIRAGMYSRALSGGFEEIWQQNAADELSRAGNETFEAIEHLKRADPGRYKPANGAVYPRSKLGRSMQQIAQLIKAGVGLEIAFAEANGWDTHVNQGGSRGQLANLLRDFANSIAAFTTDLGQKMDDVLLLTMSEFGRTAKENGNRGTDHGHGNAMLVMGNSVKGGKVYGDWKGLRNSELYEGRDLAVTTDFRDVFGEAAYRHLAVKDLGKLFPGYSASPEKFRRFLG